MPIEIKQTIKIKAGDLVHYRVKKVVTVATWRCPNPSALSWVVGMQAQCCLDVWEVGNLDFI